jgi:hypothetical protein
LSGSRIERISEALGVEPGRVMTDPDVDEDGYEAPIWLPPEELRRLQDQRNREVSEMLDRLVVRRNGDA